MKSYPMTCCIDSQLRCLLIVGAMLMAGTASVHGQTVPPPTTHQRTRAEVVHELEELEAAGYNPARGDDILYPVDIQAAEEKLAAKHRAERDATMNASKDWRATPVP